MKLFCCYTPAHEILFREYFLPSVPAGFSLTAHALSIAGTGDFLSSEFLECIREKVRLIRASIRENSGELIVWSDVDIVFLGEVVPVLRKLGTARCDLLFQRESPRLPDVNTGFMAIRCGPEAAEFFERVNARLEGETQMNEQAVVNLLLRSDDPISWAHLPACFYARTQGWPPPCDAVLYHANYTKGADGVGQKIAQFRELAFLRRWGFPALAWSCVCRLPGAMIRRLEVWRR